MACPDYPIRSLTHVSCNIQFLQCKYTFFLSYKHQNHRKIIQYSDHLTIIHTVLTTQLPCDTSAAKPYPMICRTSRAIHLSPVSRSKLTGLLHIPVPLPPITLTGTSSYIQEYITYYPLSLNPWYIRCISFPLYWPQFGIRLCS